MLYPELEDKMHDAKLAFDSATSENIIELCNQYLALLAVYRTELYKLAGSPNINRRLASTSALDESDFARKTIRTAIENCTRERGRLTTLLNSLTIISGYETVETFNRHKYKGYDNWELKAGGVVRLINGFDIDRVTIEEAVIITSRLRRQEYLTQNSGMNNRGMLGPDIYNSDQDSSKEMQDENL